MVIDDEMREKASFIQRHYRQKKAKEIKKVKISSRYTQEEENIISKDPNERNMQEEKAVYIQKMFRKRKDNQK